MARRPLLLALIAAIGMGFLASGGPAQPPAAPKKPGDPPTAPSASPEESRLQQEANAALYRKFEAELLRLAQKLEKSDKPGDQDRAKTIRKALDVSETAGVGNQFKAMIEKMRANPNKTQDYADLLGGDQQLVTTLQEILTILMTDDESARIKAEIARLEAFLKEIKDLKRRTEIARALTEAQKTDKERLTKNQGDLAKETKDVADRMSGKKGGDGKPKDGSGKPKDGSGQPKDGSGNPPPSSQNAPKTPGQKNVEQAVPPQQQAEKELDKDKRPDAAKEQDKAIKELEEAMKELEKRLKQLREEEKAKLLANLEARCNKMLMMQTEVYNTTKAIHDTVTKNGGQKATADVQKSQQQADKEGEIVAEADRCLKLLETEGSAVAFTRVLEEVRADMVAVQRRLGVTIVDTDTQAIEENIIAMLKEMIAALKKAQQDLQNPPPPGNPNNNNNKPNQKLINLLAELKLIRSMQQMVNSRTQMYGKKYQGEQAADPIIDAELKQLAQRQAKLQDMINKIASGENQ